MTKTDGGFWSLPLLGLLVGRISATLTNSILAVAVGWHLYQATGNAFDLALVGLFQVSPILALFLLTGWVADNFSRRNILVASAALQIVVAIAVAIVMNQAEFNKWFLYIALLFSGVARAFFSPAIQSALVNIVNPAHLNRAIALNSVCWNAALIVGPFVAGLLVALLDTQLYWGLVLLGGFTILGFSVLPALKICNRKTISLDDLLGGIRYLKANQNVFGCMMLDLLIVLFGSVMAILPMFVSDVMQEGPEILGLLRAMPALGATIIGLYLTRSSGQFRQTGKVLFRALTVFACSILLFSVSTTTIVAAFALFVYGGSDMFSVVIRSSIVQLLTPDNLRGRVSALNGIFIASSNELGDFRSGSAAALLGPVYGVLLGGFMALGVVWGGRLWFRSLSELQEIQPDNVTK
ncbi:MAG: MFS transporter [Aestuariibacter sp.]